MNIYYLPGILAIWPAPLQLTLAWARTDPDWQYAARTGAHRRRQEGLDVS